VSLSEAHESYRARWSQTIKQESFRARWQRLR